MNTWEKNPQDRVDEHDWVEWFAPANDYRDVVWHEYGFSAVLGLGD